MNKEKWSKKDLDFFKTLINEKIQEVKSDIDEGKKRADDIKNQLK